MLIQNYFKLFSTINNISFYELLNIDRYATQSDITKAYNEKSIFIIYLVREYQKNKNKFDVFCFILIEKLF